MSQSSEVIWNSIFRDVIDASQNLREGRSKLCHYTSAENAIKMLDSKEFWLRNAKCMNDFAEINGGASMIAKILSDNDRVLLRRLSKIIDPKCEESDQTFVNLWDYWNLNDASKTFIGCLSECSVDEKVGKLSMWRAYGSQKGGICFIFNSDPFLHEGNNLGAVAFPVCYDDYLKSNTYFEECIKRLEDNVVQLSDLSVEERRNIILEGFLYRAIISKHSGFEEEREWRIVSHQNTESPIITESIEVLNGVPQIVKKIPLKHDPKAGLLKADIPNLLHRVIIGPSEFPMVVYDALIHKLTALDVENVHDKVEMSEIPLRL